MFRKYINSSYYIQKQQESSPDNIEHTSSMFLEEQSRAPKQKLGPKNDITQLQSLINSQMRNLQNLNLPNSNTLPISQANKRIKIISSSPDQYILQRPSPPPRSGQVKEQKSSLLSEQPQRQKQQQQLYQLINTLPVAPSSTLQQNLLEQRGNHTANFQSGAQIIDQQRTQKILTSYQKDSMQTYNFVNRSHSYHSALSQNNKSMQEKSLNYSKYPNLQEQISTLEKLIFKNKTFSHDEMKKGGQTTTDLRSTSKNKETLNQSLGSINQKQCLDQDSINQPYLCNNESDLNSTNEKLKQQFQLQETIPNEQVSQKLQNNYFKERKPARRLEISQFQGKRSGSNNIYQYQNVTAEFNDNNKLSLQQRPNRNNRTISHDDVFNFTLRNKLIINNRPDSKTQGREIKISSQDRLKKMQTFYLSRDTFHDGQFLSRRIRTIPSVLENADTKQQYIPSDNTLNKSNQVKKVAPTLLTKDMIDFIKLNIDNNSKNNGTNNNKGKSNLGDTNNQNGSLGFNNTGFENENNKENGEHINNLFSNKEANYNSNTNNNNQDNNNNDNQFNHKSNSNNHISSQSDNKIEDDTENQIIHLGQLKEDDIEDENCQVKFNSNFQQDINSILSKKEIKSCNNSSNDSSSKLKSTHDKKSKFKGNQYDAASLLVSKDNSQSITRKNNKSPFKQQQNQEESQLSQQQQEEQSQNLKKKVKFQQQQINEAEKHIKIEIMSRTKTGVVGYIQKKNNQDSYLISDCMENEKYEQIYLVGVMDGHGTHGHLVSQFVKSHYLSEFLKSNEEFENRLNNLNMVMSNKLNRSSIDCSFSGTTSIFLLLLFQNQTLTIISSNCGDSRAIMGLLKAAHPDSHYTFFNKNENQKNQEPEQNGSNLPIAQNQSIDEKKQQPSPQKQDKQFNSFLFEVLELSRDHKPELPDEKERILKHNGRIDSYRDEYGQQLGPMRVWMKDQNIPGIAMSRSIGDDVATSLGVTWESEIKEFTIEFNTLKTQANDNGNFEKDKYNSIDTEKKRGKLTADSGFIIVGSDGVWEFLSNEEVVKEVGRFYIMNDINGACDWLVREAYNQWTFEDKKVVDDITFIILFISPQGVITKRGRTKSNKKA